MPKMSRKSYEIAAVVKPPAEFQIAKIEMYETNPLANKSVRNKSISQ